MKKFFLIFCFSLFLVSCFNNSNTSSKNYEVIVTNDGILRTNLQNGEIVLITNNDVIKYDDNYINEQIKINKKIKQLQKVKNRSFPYADNAISFDLYYKFVNNSVFFRMIVYPYDKKLLDLLRSKDDRLTLTLYDNDDFELCSNNIYFKNWTRYVDDEGKPYAIEITNSFNCPKSLYKYHNYVSFPWVFSSETVNYLLELKKVYSKQILPLQKKLISLLNEKKLKYSQSSVFINISEIGKFNFFDKEQLQSTIDKLENFKKE